MRNFSLIGVLLAVAIIAYWAKGMLAPQVSHDPNDRSTVAYWVSHNSDRDVMLSYCNNHPDQQNTQDCKLAIAAQTQIDTQAVPKQLGHTGVTQGSGDAVDQLEAQKDANNLP
ncbi:MAG: hypothetical protein M3Z41_05035 [Candidatus Eremiobacteraeota bacterium]|nr:hypothetical protein [Candidatus Eremiobacteraeota bacterium]